jgi:hypothetical protein
VLALRSTPDQEIVNGGDARDCGLDLRQGLVDLDSGELLAGTSAECVGGHTCNWDCAGGRCAISCDGGSTCNVDCAGGGCTLECNGGAVCNFDCAGDGCQHDCNSGAVCNFDD